jgi:hypothetical protein
MKAKKTDNEGRRNNERKINIAAMKRRRLDEAYRDHERGRQVVVVSMRRKFEEYRQRHAEATKRLRAYLQYRDAERKTQ